MATPPGLKPPCKSGRCWLQHPLRRAVPTGAVVRVLAPSTSELPVDERVHLSIDWNQARLYSGRDDLLLTPIPPHEARAIAASA